MEQRFEIRNQDERGGGLHLAQPVSIETGPPRRNLVRAECYGVFENANPVRTALIERWLRMWRDVETAVLRVENVLMRKALCIDEPKKVDNKGMKVTIDIPADGKAVTVFTDGKPFAGVSQGVTEIEIHDQRPKKQPVFITNQPENKS
jgi:hypothetical protein